MISVKQAKKLTYRDTIYVKNQYGSDGYRVRWRINGKVKTWKRNPDKIEIPIKHGLYDYGYLDNSNLDFFILTDRKRPARK